MKKRWRVISNDYYELCNDFYDHNIWTRSINVSHIVPIPKTDNPNSVNEFRPISLLNSSIKLITEILANRLQLVIVNIVHQNQYGFIKNKSIQDCLAWFFEYLHLCHR
jgi:hypothetical protein